MNRLLNQGGSTLALQGNRRYSLSGIVGGSTCGFAINKATQPFLGVRTTLMDVSGPAHLSYGGGRAKPTIQRAPSQQEELYFRVAQPVEAVREALNNVEGLEDGWNGPGSKPVAAAIVALTDLILRDIGSSVGPFEVPFVAPLHNGSLQFEWETETRSVEIEAVRSEWKILKKESPADGTPIVNIVMVPLTDIPSIREAYLWARKG